ncbi:hypothetical protein EQG41_04410 [Billgrantia azerbaijanica]|nr:hypothetical protein EQG41_04410 [Halomonas azerbaijanica]
MISLAARRLPGLAHRGPALFMLLLVLMPTALLSACRNHLQEQQLQGTALGTAYHLTLYAEPGEASSALRVAIQGELVRLEGQHALLLQWLRGAALLPPPWAARIVPVATWQGGELATLMHALAADRLAERLRANGIVHAMIEVGGIVRVLDNPRRQGWRLALDHAALPDQAVRRRLALRHAALMTRLVDGHHLPAASAGMSRLLAVSVVAGTAVEAWHEAHRLVTTTSIEAARRQERAARFVVSTPNGIDISQTPALERWLEP